MEMYNRCLEQNINLTIKGKKKHFTGVVKNMAFSQTVKNIHLSVVLRINSLVCRERKKGEIVEMYKMTTHLRIQCTLYIYQWAITIINKYGPPTCNSPIVSSSFLRKLAYFFLFFLKHKLFLKIYCNMIHMHFWASFLLSTFQIHISKKYTLWNTKKNYRKKIASL